MALDAFVQPWTGDSYRNAPRPFRTSVLSFQLEGRLQDNRWNVRGERTLYFAGDPEVATAEFVRHLEQDRSPVLVPKTIERDIFVCKGIKLERLLDLRDPRVLNALSIDNAPDCFKDVGLARAVAQLIRRGSTNAQGMIVPSMAFLDDLSHWVMVLFLEHLPAGPRSFISGIKLHSTITIHPLRRPVINGPA